MNQHHGREALVTYMHTLDVQLPSIARFALLIAPVDSVGMLCSEE